jgi:hypothetical protein
MILSGILLICAGAASVLVPLLNRRWADLSPLGAALPLIGAASLLAGIVLLVLGFLRRRTSTVFDSELDKMSDEDVLRTVKEIESIKEGNGDTLVGLVEEAPLAETKAELDEIVDRYSKKMAVSRHTVMTVLKHSRKLKKIKGAEES